MRLAERALRAWHLDLFTYVLSKVWFDLLFVYVLRLLPRPYCCPVGESPRQRLFFSLVLKQCSAAESTATPCRESASAAALLAAAAALLASLGLIDQGVQSLAMRNASAARLVQSVAGMFLGWALGHAYAHAISEGGGAVCGDGWTCSIFADLASAVLVTVSAAPLVAALLRLASCGGGADAAAAEESSGERDGAGGVLRRCVCSCARLLAGGLSTMTMVAWVEVRVRVRVSTLGRWLPGSRRRRARGGPVRTTLLTRRGGRTAGAQELHHGDGPAGPAARRAAGAFRGPSRSPRGAF